MIPSCLGVCIEVKSRRSVCGLVRNSSVRRNAMELIGIARFRFRLICEADQKWSMFKMNQVLRFWTCGFLGRFYRLVPEFDGLNSLSLSHGLHRSWVIRYLILYFESKSWSPSFWCRPEDSKQNGELKIVILNLWSIRFSERIPSKSLWSSHKSNRLSSSFVTDLRWLKPIL